MSTMIEMKVAVGKMKQQSERIEAGNTNKVPKA